MSHNSSSNKQSSGNNRSGTSQQQRRSIPAIIHTLQSTFRDADYREAEKELISREENLIRKKDRIAIDLRERCDLLETDLKDLRMQKLTWETERRRLMRELEVKDDQLNDYARDLSVSKDMEVKAIQRYERSLEDIRELEREKEELLREKDEEGCEYIGKLSGLKENVEDLERKLSEKEEEIDGVRRKNVGLEKEMAKFDTLLGETKRVVEEQGREIKELLVRNKGLEEEKAKFKVNFEEMWRSVEEKERKIEEVLRKNEDLERRKNDGSNKLLKRIEGLEDDIIDIVKLKDGKIEELEKEKEGLQKEKKNIVEKYKQVEERFLKLQEDAINCLCLDVKRDKKFGSSQIGKIIAGILNEIESQKDAVGNGLKKDGNFQEADSAFVPHVNELNCPLKSTVKSEEAVRRILDFEEENLKENGSSCNKKPPSTDIIQIDSDDDDETPLFANNLKRKSESSESLREMHNDDSSGDDTLNPKHKIKKLEHVLRETTMPSIVAPGSKGDRKFSGVQRQTLATIRKCEESLSKKVKCASASASAFCLTEGNGSEDIHRSFRPDSYSNPEVEEFIASARKRRENKMLADAAAMSCAFDEDAMFCAQAVCALYRLHKRQFNQMSGLIRSRSRGVEQCDVGRVTSLAKFLIDGDPTCKMKKSVNELQQHDASGPRDCTSLAGRYYKQLFEIFKNNEDPLFSTLTTDLEYT